MKIDCQVKRSTEIQLTKVRIYIHSEDPAFSGYPASDDIITIKAIVWAKNKNGAIYGGYSDVDLVNDGRWFAPGTNCPDLDVPEMTPTLSSTETINRWPNGWPALTFKWNILYHKGSSKCDNNCSRKYSYELPYQNITTISGWGRDNVCLSEWPIGTARYRVIANLDEGEENFHCISSLDKQTALRISIGNSDYPNDPNGTDYLRWLSSFLNVPYEWGGVWYGGLEGNNVGGGDTYEGYGVDCSGLISVAANLAGYKWSPWHKTTRSLCKVSTPLDESEPLLPGDILNKVGDHVVTITRVNSSNSSNILVDIVEAVGGTVNKVRSLVDVPLKDYLNNGYIARRLHIIQMD